MADSVSRRSLEADLGEVLEVAAGVAWAIRLEEREWTSEVLGLA